ncbi:hypothetical protein BFP72_02610 [Reichenbachiella sp. 5M10]|uniref:HTTM domain-containing protein n=1 Tax=Reichenbachiella sp. 5M10 TaxID=1889772 RepID=UPI000C145881|nr:HTTM domain-containing protein [Reichenbachiella sp. 5M10]PIB34392.1 hypothetical protein BFP72_02610 [Reichenbachiella sp. 5M10]
MPTPLRNEFFKPIDNSPIVVFRVLFGLLMAVESFGAIATGWVGRVFIEPSMHFPFIWTNWLSPLPGHGMYYYYVVMGVASLMVAAGYRYRWSSLVLALLWSGCYFMQKTSYNNHYYFAVLLCWFMAMINPQYRLSLDSQRTGIVQEYMPNWYRLFFVLQVFIVFTFASVAKLSDSWISGDFIQYKFASKASYPIIGDLLVTPWFQYLITYSGIVFDGLISPLLLWKRTRKIAFAALIGFNLFNSVIFQIGIFPYMMVALAIFFFEPDQIRKFFFKKGPDKQPSQVSTPSWVLYLFTAYFAWQIYLPLRHHWIEGDVLWTEEGHRLSWRMMLRSRSGSASFKVVDSQTGQEFSVRKKDYLTSKQSHKVSAHPDFAWQFAQFLHQEYLAKGVSDPQVYCQKSRLRINQGPYKTLIDPSVDLAHVPWDYLGHNAWVLLDGERKH